MSGYSLIGMATLGGFAYGYVHSVVYRPGDLLGTAHAINQHSTLFISGIIAWLIVIVLDLLVAGGVYRIYRAVHPALASACASLRIIYAIVLAVAVAQLIDILMSPVPVNALSAFESFETIWSAGLVLFGLHLITLAWLGFLSPFTPNTVSATLGLAAIGYLLLESLDVFCMRHVMVHPTIETVLNVPMVLGELLFSAWLIKSSYYAWSPA